MHLNWIFISRLQGVGSWELGVGEEVVGEEVVVNLPSPQSPVPNPQSPKRLIKIMCFKCTTAYQLNIIE
jgi:hypothetical protein